jgi:DHA1 family bicyclomycin/chloramphenicol resistance-like MFS transporter
MAGLVIAFVGGALLLGLKAADVGGLAAYAAPVSVFLFGMGLANPLGTAMTLSPFGDRAGLASALLGFVQMAGAAVGATLATSLALTPVTALGSVLTSFLGPAILLFAARKGRSHRAGTIAA